MINVEELTACQELVERDSKVIAPCQHLSYFPLGVAKGDGDIITDVDGNDFIDFLSSASSLNLGTANPIINDAIKEQIDNFAQYTQAYTYNRQSVEYAERLVSVYPGGIDAKVCFGNCGSDANDAAVKFSRAFTGRQKVIVFINGYHGSTYGSATMTTCTTKMKSKMGPFLPEIYAFPFFGIDQDDETVERECLAQIHQAFESYLPAEEVACVVIEPIQGDGGILPAHPIFMKKLYEMCQEHGIMFIAEEVQQGFYRTGTMFSIEHYGIVPDGIVMGKSIGASLTLGAFMGRTDMMDCLPAPAHLFSLGANSVACAAGNAAFDYFQSDEFQSLLKTNIDLLQELAADLKKNHPDTVSFTRGIGLSMGIGIKGLSPETVNDDAFKVIFRSYQKGLLVITIAGDVIRIQPPLNIKPENLRRGFEILDESLTELENGQIGDDVLAYKAGW